MKVLLVAPTQADLPSQIDEVQSIISSGLTVHPLLGQVRHTDMLRAMVDGRYDVLWLATHGSNEGVALSDGILSASLLTSMVRGRVRLVVLNTCSSIQAAQMIQQESGAAVICTVTDVQDREASQTGALLARALADTGKIEIAYERSRPGENRTYVLLAARGKRSVSDSDVVGRLSAEMGELTKALYELRSELALLKQRLEQLERAIDKPRPDDPRKINMVLSFIVFISSLMMTGLYLLAFRGGV